MKTKDIIRFSSVIAASALATVACTKSFEKFNTNPDAVQEIDSKSYITTMIMDAVIPCSDVGANEFQRACNLMGDSFAGYLAPTQAFNGGSYTCTYDLDGTEYNNVPFSVTFTNVMPAWLNLKYAHQNGLIGDEIFAVAEVIKVMSLQRTSDIYGPLPVSGFGEDENPYESQETVYKNLFTDLDSAIEVLKKYAASSNGSTTMLTAVDPVFNGDYSKWLKLANSEKLRMAMRIRFVEPDLAKQYAEEAVLDGVMTTAADCAYLKSSSTIQVFNPLEEVWNAYKDTRMGATMDCYLNGYNDPRLPKYFSESTVDGGGYHGVRSGIRQMIQDNYLSLSVPNVSKSTPVVWMLASESAFLRAEGALIGWDMGGDAAGFYKEGVVLSFVENGLTDAAANAYLASDNAPIAFEDKNKGTTKDSYSAPSDITPKWNDGDSAERKLERIITQKWIAMYPNGQEAWSEFRRTGYPKVIPVKDNLSSGKINTQVQVRRMTFPRSEYSNNYENLQKAISLIGGSDNGGVKLWWDKK
ncbi:MAG: SusD/RagB family nutrient-binding outer membrane lipoprotein [Bacteroides sp.]|nr:SusD/RagB family nutrient-binding outer membrane lipoprotein [Bacteroides sp.]